MCEPRPSAVVSAGVVAAAAAALSMPGALRAQATTPDPAEVRERIDALEPEWREAERRRRRADSLRALEREARRRLLDTVRVGPLTVLTEAEHVTEAGTTFEEVWGELTPLVGSAAPRLVRYRFLYRADDVEHGWDASADTVLEVDLGRWTTPARLHRRARNAVGAALTRELPDELRRWIGEESLAAEVEWPSVYRSLATAPSRVARRCFEEGLDCWAAVGLEGRADGWENWYTPAERRRLVSRQRPGRWGPEANSALQACVEGEVGACDRFIRLRGWTAPPPVGSEGRASLVVFALRTGGAGSYARLVEGDGPIRERLARTAGHGPDELARAWRDHVLSRSPRVHADLSRTGWTTLAWILLFVVLATRSTRWRLA